MSIDYAAIAPELTLSATALVVLMVDLVLRGDYKQYLNPLAAVGTVVAIGLTVPLWGDPRSTFGGSFVVNDFAVVFKLLFLGALLAILGISWRFFAEGRYFQGEYYFLLVTAFLGMIIMPSARDLLILFVALETVSVPGFVMAGMRKRDLYSSEAAIKFFLIGVLSVALMLFGMSLVYGFTGTTELTGIATALSELQQTAALPPLLLASVMLVIVGFGFKVSAVPFHFWAPDTYAGSPMPVAAMLAVASKAAGFAGLVAVTFIAFEPVAGVWAPVVGVLAVLTMTTGNLIALQQADIIRLLAYSSVAQAGYMLIPFGLVEAGNTQLINSAAQATLFYIVAYAFMNVGAFGTAIAVARRSGERSLRDYAGLSARSPLLAMGMTVFLLSLGGAPATVGLWAKFEIIRAAADADSVFGYALVSFLVVNVVIGFFYYLRVIRTMWMDEAREGAPALKPGFSLSAVVVVLMVGTVLLGILPGLVTEYSSVAQLLAGVG